MQIGSETIQSFVFGMQENKSNSVVLVPVSFHVVFHVVRDGDELTWLSHPE